MKEFIKQHWKYLVPLLVLILMFSIGYYEWQQHKSMPQATLPVAQYITKDDLAKALAELKKDSSSTHVQTLRETIIEREKAPPDTSFTTKTQAEADKKANEIAKDDKADYLLKQPKEKNGEIQNFYYGIHEQKNNQIKAGFTVGEYNSLDIGYQYKKLEIIGHKSLDKNSGSVTVMTTVLQW